MIAKRERVADRRLDAWLDGWGPEKLVRLDGGVHAERPHKNPHRDGSKKTAVHINACYADIEKHFGRASVMVQGYLLERFGHGRELTLEDYLAERYCEDIPRHYLQAVARNVEKNYRLWRDQTARALRL